jgi:HEPN domain-containing protein
MDPYDDIEALRQRSAEDLRVAEILVEADDEFLAHIGFNLQQFIEKKMKVSLYEHGINYPKTHDLVMLLGLFPQKLVSEDDETFAYILSRFAVESRYGKRSVPLFDGRQILAKTRKFADLIETLWEGP